MLELASRSPGTAVHRGFRFQWVSRRTLLGWGTMLSFLAWWQLLASSGAARADLISSPAEVLMAGVSLASSGELAFHALLSVWELTLGFLPATVVGVLVGLALARPGGCAICSSR